MTMSVLNTTVYFVAVSFLVLILQGCTGVKPSMDVQPAPVAADEVEESLPFVTPKPEHVELDSDLVFSYMVAEMAARRGNLKMALAHYLHAALLANDPYAAERASRIAIFLRDNTTGLRAARRWVGLAPNSMLARQLTAILFLRSDQEEAALEHLDALIKIADARDHDGFMQIANVLNGEADQNVTVRVMQKLLDSHKRDARAHYALGLVLVAQRRYAGAQTRLQAAIERKPDWARPRIMLSRVLSTMGKGEQALAYMARAVADLPDNTRLRISYAHRLVDANRFPAALDQFRQLYKLIPDDADVLFGLAMLAMQEQQWQEARDAWQHLRGKPRRYDDATYYLAQVEDYAGNKELAIGLYGSVRKGDLKPDAMIRRAQLLAGQGKLHEAREELKAARVTHVSRAVDFYLVETGLLQDYGQPSEVFALYAEAIKAHPEDNDLLYNQALFSSDQGDHAAMERDLKEVLRREPDNADALNALGYTLADIDKRLDEAFGYIARALKLKPDHPAVLDSMGWIYYRMGNHAQAVKYLRMALEKKASDDEIAAHLGEVLWVSGEKDQAQDVWQKALEINPDSSRLKMVIQRFRP